MLTERYIVFSIFVICRFVSRKVASKHHNSTVIKQNSQRDNNMMKDIHLQIRMCNILSLDIQSKRKQCKKNNRSFLFFLFTCLYRTRYDSLDVILALSVLKIHVSTFFTFLLVSFNRYLPIPQVKLKKNLSVKEMSSRCDSILAL